MFIMSLEKFVTLLYVKKYDPCLSNCMQIVVSNVQIVYLYI